MQAEYRLQSKAGQKEDPDRIVSLFSVRNSSTKSYTLRHSCPSSQEKSTWKFVSAPLRKHIGGFLGEKEVSKNSKEITLERSPQKKMGDEYLLSLPLDGKEKDKMFERLKQIWHFEKTVLDALSKSTPAEANISILILLQRIHPSEPDDTSVIPFQKVIYEYEIENKIITDYHLKFQVSVDIKDQPTLTTDALSFKKFVVISTETQRRLDPAIFSY